MPINRNALLRYKTIDRCLQNRFRKWTLNDLVEACSEALYEYEGIDKGVSKRTIQGDIQTMRSDKLGYNAPIIVVDRRYYTYKDKGYSITNAPLTEQDLKKLSEAVGVMKQFQGFSYFQELSSMVQKLESQIYAQRTHSKPVIDFERNDNLKGLSFLNALYQAIIRQQVLEITYQSFKARTPQQMIFHPYLLKEFRNRWFVFGKKSMATTITSLALDRIQLLNLSNQPFEATPSFDPSTYFQHVIGVSANPNIAPQHVVLQVNHYHAPYVETKPFHPSQKVICRNHEGVTIELRVQLNYELEKLILGFGEGIQVLQPEPLKNNIQRRLLESIELYQQEHTEKGRLILQQRLKNKGYALYYKLYSQRAIRQFQKQYKHILTATNQTQIEHILINYPKSKHFITTHALVRLLSKTFAKAFLVETHYYTQAPNFEYTWQQGQDLPVERTMDNAPAWTKQQKEQVLKHTYSMYVSLEEGMHKKIKIELLSGSPTRLLEVEQCTLIGENSCPYSPNLPQGTALILNDLAIRRFKNIQTATTLLYLRFSTAALPDGWRWKHLVQIDENFH